MIRAEGAPRRPKTILVLGGGGLRGVAHVGVLRAIERLGLRIDEVVGTSIGAVVGAMFAAGRRASELEAAVTRFGRADWFRRRLFGKVHGSARAPSLYRGRMLRGYLRRGLPVRSFAALRLPFFANATSLETGANLFFGSEGLREASLPEAVYASCAVPGIFEPAELEGLHFVDGGIGDLVPIQFARSRGAELVIAVDLGLPDRPRGTPYQPGLEFALFRAFEILEQALREARLHAAVDPSVVLVQPKVGDRGRFETEGLLDLVRLGEREALRVFRASPQVASWCDPEAIEALAPPAEPRVYVRLAVDARLCIRCGLCAAVCPTGGYREPNGMDDPVAAPHHYACTRDGSCARQCPTGAIRLENL